VVSVHLAGTPGERLAQADSLTRTFADRDHPVILAGDFNGRPDDPVLRRLARDWRILPKGGDPATYPSPEPDREIDFVLVSRGSGIEVVEHRVVEEAVASDHRPVVAVLKLP
jgi:endonuclease/exonuclease/phosphatase family metal-dependent hydrolase